MKSVSSKNKIKTLLISAKDLEKEGKLDFAAEKYHKILQLDSKHLSSLKHLGIIYEKQGRLEQAVDCYKQALIYHPQESILYIHLAQALEQQSKVDEAIAVYQEAVNAKISEKRLSKIHLSLGKLLQKKGKLDEAYKSYLEARKINQNDIKIQKGSVLLGNLLTQQKKTAEAIQCFQDQTYAKNLKLKPGYVKKYWKLGQVKKPKFIIIGAMKCGTTSLYDYITQHPKILHASRKELHFFDYTDRFELGLDLYLSHFPPIPDGESFIVGEATPSYLINFLVAQRIKENCPDTKFIVILRNPVFRTISQYYFGLNNGKYSTSLEEVVNSGINKINSMKNIGIEIDGQADCISRSLYFYYLNKWMEIFPKNKFLILTSEELKNNSVKTMDIIFNFLEVRPYKKVNFSQKRSAKNYTSTSINVNLRKKLSDFFEPHNRKLEDLLQMKFNWE